jgi:NAD-dependent deacetylase
MRPDIVWFGETPYGMDECYAALAEADIFIAIGTSGMVYPAASFATLSRKNGRMCRTVEINPEPTGNGDFVEIIKDSAARAVPRLVNKLREFS